ncbi:hypothetical protein L345_05490, partial [Ophiophagus hannah]
MFVNVDWHPEQLSKRKPTQSIKKDFISVDQISRVGKGEEFSHLDFATERIQRSKERTCQWLYTQVWDFEGASPRTEKW